MDLLDLFAKIGIDTTEYEQGIANASNTASKLGGALKTAAKVGAAAIGAASAAVTAFAGDAVRTAMSFDSSMSQVAATMGYTMDELNTEGSEAAQTFEKLSEFAQKMGAETAFSASQAADALNYMALAGYDADTSIEMLPNVLNLAAAGGIGLAEASDMVTDASSALGLSLDETSELVDKMARASSKSNTSVAQLGQAILTVGGTAKNLAGGTTELSQALGILADNGIKGAEGGTALRNIILALSAPTDTAANAMERIGLEAYDADGNLRSLEDIFSDLNKVLSTMTQGEQTNVLNEIFNKVDLKSANALLGTNADRWAELTREIDNAEGSAAAMAEVQLDNLAGDITLFQSALEGAKIAVSDTLTPSLREMVQFGSAAISTLSEAFKEGGLSGAMESLGTLLSEGLAMVTSKLPEMVKAGTKLLWALVEGIIDNLPVLIDAAIEVILFLVQELTKPENLEKLVTAAFKIIIAIGRGLLEALPQLLEAVGTIVVEFGKYLGGRWADFAAKGREIIPAVGDGIRSAIDAAKNWGRDLIQNFLDGIKQKWQALKEGVANVANTVKSFLGFSEPDEGPLSDFHTYAPDMMELFAKGIKDNAGLLKDAFGSALDFGLQDAQMRDNVYGNGAYVNDAAGGDIVITVQSVLDGEVIGETAYRYSRKRERAYGV